VGLLDAVIDEYQPTHVFGMFSGGHDSVCSTHLAAQHPRFTAAVHINTGIGVEQTREYVRRTCADLGWPLIELRTDPSVYRRQVLGYGFPAGGQPHSLLYRILKERRVEELVRIHKQARGDRILLVAGARRQESRVRMGSTQAVMRRGAQVWVNPILDFSHADKEDYMERHQLPRNPVVDHLHMSGECLCGCFANMPESHELEQIGFFYPEVMAQIRDLEHEVYRAGKWHNWGTFRPEHVPELDDRQAWLPLCQDCPTRWLA
jgi:3'-phosphoadenosine 5'-phosphosulfate sulfotransferase (PAPS reductase)/FAD synthetase